MWLYASLLFGSLLVPLALSFDSKLRFWRKWNKVLPAMFIIASVYICFDILFTHLGVWGFNQRYHIGLVFWGLPLEEYLFFLIIPYSSLFLHYALFYYYPKAHLSLKLGKFLSIILISLSVLIIVFNIEKLYTVYAFVMLLLALLVSVNWNKKDLHRFYTSFLIILVPFLLVNGILTGSLIEQEVVFYNSIENLGLRVFTVPVEDFAYGFSLILFNLVVINMLNHNTSLYHD